MQISNADRPCAPWRLALRCCWFIALTAAFGAQAQEIKVGGTGAGLGTVSASVWWPSMPRRPAVQTCSALPIPRVMRPRSKGETASACSTAATPTWLSGAPTWPIGLGSIDFAHYFGELARRGFSGPGILEIGGLPKSGGYGRDTDQALIASLAALAQR